MKHIRPDDLTPNNMRPSLGGIVTAFSEYLKHATSIWTVADLVFAYAGAPGEVAGRHNGSEQRLKEIATKLKEVFGAEARGFGLKHIERLRTTAFKFPPPQRCGGIGLHLHRAAGDWATLLAAVAEAERLGNKLTHSFIVKFLKRNDTRRQWAITWERLRQSLADVASKADWCLTHFRQHPADLTPQDRTALLNDLPAIRAAIDRTSIALTELEGAL
jgi:hypothetical protein